YDRPAEIMRQLPENTVGLAITVVYESGVRISEGTAIGAGQLQGLGRDPHTGKEVGMFTYVGKGGKEGTAMVSPATYDQLATAVQNGNGKFEVSQQAVRETLKESVEKTGQSYEGHGVHGLRWTH